jgi:hypothetical protein
LNLYAMARFDLERQAAGKVHPFGTLALWIKADASVHTRAISTTATDNG